MGEQEVTPCLLREYFFYRTPVNIHLKSVFINEFLQLFFAHRKGFVIIDISCIVFYDDPIDPAFKDSVSSLQNKWKFCVRVCLWEVRLRRKNHIFSKSLYF